MKKQFLNREGTQDNLEYYNKEGILIYKFYNCFSNEENVKEIVEVTYDNFGNTLKVIDSIGYSYEYTRCKETGNELTYKDSTGVKKRFDLPEYTMQQITKKIGDFKLIE